RWTRELCPRLRRGQRGRRPRTRMDRGAGGTLMVVSGGATGPGERHYRRCRNVLEGVSMALCRGTRHHQCGAGDWTALCQAATPSVPWATVRCADLLSLKEGLNVHTA